MATYFDLLPEELNEIIWKQLHHLRMADLKIDVEMHYMYRYVYYDDHIIDSISHAAILCKRDWEILDLDSAFSAAIVSSRRSNRFFCKNKRENRLRQNNAPY